MQRYMVTAVFVMFLLAGCILTAERRGRGVTLVPALPKIVVLEVEPYFQQGDFFYYYQDNRWSYSNSRGGPWVELPRDRYPHEVRFKGRGGDTNNTIEKRDRDGRGRD